MAGTDVRIVGKPSGAAMAARLLLESALYFLR
jgi:hypothetical protein